MNTSLFKILACGGIIALVSSCSVFNGNKKSSTTISGSQAQTTQPTQPATPATPSLTPEKETPAAAQKLPQSMKSAFSRDLGGQWTIMQVASKTIERDEDMPYIIFEPSTARFYASNGCNTLNGSYEVNDKDNTVTFHNILSTLRLCPDVNFDNDINAVVTENVPVALKMKEVGSETFLEFISSSGKVLMSARRGNLEFLNGQWDVESISGLDKLDTPAAVFFDIAEKKLHGNTGCNIVNGNIYLDHRRSNAVDFSNMITTRMACPYDKQQTAFLVALEEAETAISDGTDRVMLLGTDGRILMTLKKAATVYED